jgi:hypothetical protein
MTDQQMNVALQATLIRLLPMAIFGQYAKLGLIATCLLFILGLVITLPFSPLYAFMVFIPLGALAAWRVSKVQSVRTVS